MNLIRKLLKSNLSKGQILGYAVANIVGLSVILTGILFFCDARHQLDQEDEFFSNDYVVISRPVAGLGGEPLGFDSQDIEELRAQKWTKKVGAFTTSRFAVKGSIGMGGRSMSTYLFFESVPDEFFDVRPADWGFDPRHPHIPIVLSKDYLALYNYGFALPQGLPQMSEQMVGAIPLSLSITGENGEPVQLEARIVGFSSRLNTIAVPQQFMDWANRLFGSEDQPNPSRLILQVDRLQSADMQRFLEEHGYEMAGDNNGTAKVSDFLSVVSSVVTINGLIISVLALFILLLSIYLLLQKSQEKLRNLMLLGYSPADAGRYYRRFVFVANLLITAIAIGVAFLARSFWTAPLEELGLGGASPVWMLLSALIYLIIISIINSCVIRSRLLSIWRS